MKRALCAIWIAMAAAIGHDGLLATPLQNALQPFGPDARHIAVLWWATLAICTLVFVAVLAALGYALWRSRAPAVADRPDLEPSTARERRAWAGIAAALCASALLLVALIVASVLTDRALATSRAGDPLKIELTAHQWWWEARYEDPEPARMFTTANEVHIPVGRPVSITLKASDVIHTFWVPNLHGKKDMIPGRTATIRLQAEQAGSYRGQCAEFCGLQHAHMALLVVAQPASEFESWAAGQRRPAREPANETETRGKQLFENGTCAACHAVQGTTANGRMGPDLTHVGGRSSLAAGTLANSPAALGGWISDPQKFKPGANMPSHALPGADLAALVAYLSALE